MARLFHEGLFLPCLNQTDRVDTGAPMSIQKAPVQLKAKAAAFQFPCTTENEKQSKGNLMANDPQTGVTVTNWNACYNSGDDMIVLSCTVTTNDSSAAITGVGLVLNNRAGKTVGSTYAELSNGCESATPSLNLSPGGLQVGDRVMGVTTGEAGGQHFFFEQELVMGAC
jgi:hypothetical protein